MPSTSCVRMLACLMAMALAVSAAYGAGQPTSGALAGPGSAGQGGGGMLSPDFLQWALTQGGLVIVVLVVIWSYRRDFTRILKKEEANVELLANLVGETKAAVQRSADASGGQEKAIDRLARAVEAMKE